MKQRVYIETYGCQMNVADSELVATILKKDNYCIVQNPKEADIILLNTCSIRDNAEQRIHKRVNQLQSFRKKNPSLRIGIIGCMAERIEEGLAEAGLNINILAGPDSYRNISGIIDASENQKITDIVLSHTETYEDILPDIQYQNGISAFIPVMRGCENFCSYCVVPYTRGRERSRDPESIMKEAEHHVQNGICEITLLGQNVNSYLFDHSGEKIVFHVLLGKLAETFPKIRFRFATSHPKDISDDLIHCIASHPNICNSIHLPIQSGSNDILGRMNRKYTREWYLERIKIIKQLIPDCTISTDIITGFCGETEEDHQMTLTVMREVGFYYAYMFKYSERAGTAAAKRFQDNVSEDVKTRRLTEIINLQHELSLAHNKSDLNTTVEVLVENISKRKETELMGRTSGNKVIIFEGTLSSTPPGSLVLVNITDYTSATLKGKLV